METGIKIEGMVVDEKIFAAQADAVKVIFKAGFDTHMDQETVRAALPIMPSPTYNITDCSVGTN